MKTDLTAAQMRQDLDAKSKPWRRLTAAYQDRPKRAFIRETREALGMTAAQLGRRLNMTASGVAALETSEREGTIQLATLRKVAKALGGTLIYMVVPDRPLEVMVRNRRRTIAETHLKGISKKFDAREFRDLLDAYARKLKSRKVWE